MTAELVRGQNHPLSQSRVEIRVTAGAPVLALAAVYDAEGRVGGPGALARPGSSAPPGLQAPGPAAGEHRFAVDLGAVGPGADQIKVVLVLPPGGPARFGAIPAPYVAVAAPDGDVLAGYALTGLDPETAVVAVELYRRQGAWKVRAVGQGYAGGLAALLADAGLGAPAAADLASAVAGPAAADGRAPTPVQAATVPTPPQGLMVPGPTGSTGPGPAGPTGPTGRPDPEAVAAPASGTPYPGTPGPAPAAGPADSPGGPPTVDYVHPRRRRTTGEPPEPAPAVAAGRPGEPPAPVAGDASGWSMDERLYNQVWGMFEDLARTVAAYRSACDFADSRLDRELDQALSDPRDRAAGASAQAAARARREELVAQAKTALDRDLAQLAAESDVVEPALPAAYARWSNPVWQGLALPEEAPMALRLGDLHLPERPGLRIPMLVRVPLERGLWIDNGRTGSEAAMATDTDRLRKAAMDMAVAHAARLLAVHPAGRFSVHVIDAAGAGAASLGPLVHAGVLAAPPAAGAAGVSETLARLTRRVDLVQMALRAGAPEELPPDVDTAEQLLIVHDFPHGFDDRAVTQLRYLADEGPAVGVHLLLVADRDEASAYGPLLDPLWRSLMRLTPVPDDHLSDPWVGHHWTFEPDLPPPGSLVLEEVLQRVATARRHARP
ncbi:TerD family protein [Streptomyces sp. BR123]|uniref:TerD family protein n=1 Tax=Streptomyces sp. BR123 TaxID=2749828 RepID=UPI0015C486B5|nr:TerD family protein [Streptomyces sp. BR123]NXY93173.1 TerD family protein [Streptomyces sp. BR123]